MSDAARAAASAKICDKIIHSHEFMASRIVACYLPIRDEVDPVAIIERAWCAGKRVFAPITDTHSVMNFCEMTPDTIVTRNRFGIWEPRSHTIITARSLDIVITPLVAFDEERHRIGMGGGYFDRCFHFLRNRRKWLKPKLIGVAFECQKVEKITPNAWDISLYKTITEAN